MAKDKKAAKPKKEPKAKKEKTKKEPKAKKGKAAKGETAPAAPSKYAPRPAAAAAPTPKPKKHRAVLLLVVLAVAAGVYFGVPYIKHSSSYKGAVAQIQKGGYGTARETLDGLGNFRDACVLRNYALARELYGSGIGTSGAALDHVKLCLQTIPADYSGDLAVEIAKFKTTFGVYSSNGGTVDSSALGGSASGVKHNNNFYQAVAEFYEGAAHFWDEETDG